MVAMCALYALPNIYGEDHAVQISAGRDAVVTNATVEQVKAALTKKTSRRSVLSLRTTKFWFAFLIQIHN